MISIKNLAIIGNGKTSQAISKRYPKNLIIFDDECKTDYYNKDGNLVRNSSTFNEVNFKIVIPSPGIIPSNKMIIDAKDKIVSDLDFFYDQQLFYIWITGTNGKSTLTNTIYQLLKDNNAEIGGNIGYPLAELNYNKKIHVYELSSFTLHHTKFAKPNISIILPITQDHIEWHGNFKNYENDKLKHITRLDVNSIVIIPKKYKDIDTKAYKIVYDSIDELALKYNIKEHEHNKILAGIVYKIIFNKVPNEKLSKLNVLLEHRIEPIIDCDGLTWYNDSKATNSESTIYALNKFISKVHLIIGGYDKKLDYNDLFNIIKEKNVSIYIIGANCEKLKALADIKKITYTVTKDLKNSIKKIKQNIKDGEIPILSPATSSFDQFNSFIERGLKFKKLINNLK